MAFDLESWARAWSADLGPALEQAIAAVAGQVPDEDIVGVGIATDADATSIVAFANSRSHLAQLIAEDPDYAIDGKWNLGEWDLDITGREGLDDPLESIRADAAHGMEQLLPKDAPAAAVPGLREFRRTVWATLSRAMTDSVVRGFFDRWPHAVRVFLPLDAGISEHWIAEWNAALNDPAAHEQFRMFLQLDGDGPGNDETLRPLGPRATSEKLEVTAEKLCGDRESVGSIRQHQGAFIGALFDVTEPDVRQGELDVPPVFVVDVDDAVLLVSRVEFVGARRTAPA